ncbi:MAG TPA: hypothetical protein DCZ95_18220 [Verrucomicrobia bacterium]|nr:hypothetical protein [Verrucomicrobiota bacterium]
MPRIQKETEAWFDYPNDPDGGRALIRLLKDGKQDLIKSKCREMVMTETGEPGFRTDARLEIIIESVVDWKNFIGADGQQLKCTRANISLMCAEDGFMKWVDECIAELEKRKAEQVKAEVKN